MNRLPLSKVSFSSVFWKIFAPLILCTFILFAAMSYIFFTQTFRLLDGEASERLEENAKFLAHAFTQFPKQDRQKWAESVMESRFRVSSGKGWIQNAYWLDLEGSTPRFVASFSVPASSGVSVLPPQVEEVEDLIEESLSALEDGRTAFPNPFFKKEQRRFKIVLMPILDSLGLLSSVVGLEADLEYLSLPQSLKKTWWTLIGVTLGISVLLSLLLAKYLEGKIVILLDDLHQVEMRRSPKSAPLGIAELDAIRTGIHQLGDAIEHHNRTLLEFYDEKLSDLALTGGAIAHEIRNPLSAVEVHLGLIKRKYKPEGEGLESFREIEEQLTRQKNLIERFLVYSKRVEIHPEPLPILPFVEGILNGFRLTKKAFSSQLDIPPDHVFSVDRELFRQILENLISNSLETGENDIHLQIRTTITQNGLIMDVIDSGPGIPSDFVSRLFTPFASQKPEGHGIGLALSRKLIESHGGSIHYFPNPDGGAWFQMLIPHFAFPPKS